MAAKVQGVTLDEHISDQITELDEAFARIDEVFGNLTTIDYHDITKNMTSLDKAKYDLTNMYAINSLFWMYLRSFGDDPKNTSIKEELDRIKKQMLRLSQIVSKSKMPRVDKDAANRFVRHNLPRNKIVPTKLTKGSAETTEENWDEEAMETDAKIQEAANGNAPTYTAIARKRKREAVDDGDGGSNHSDEDESNCSTPNHDGG